MCAISPYERRYIEYQRLFISYQSLPGPNEQWRSQDLILGGGKNNLRGSGASEGGGGKGVGEGCPPFHSESFLHFDVINGAIWCICPVFSSYSTNLYNLTLEMVEKRQLHMHVHATLFPFFLPSKS